MPNAFARASDAIKVGLVGCGGRGTGAADNICVAAGTSYNIKIHALGDAFEDRANNCFEALKNNGNAQGKLDLTKERVFHGFDAFQKVVDACDLVILATPPGFRPQHLEYAIQRGQERLHREAGRGRRHRHPQGFGGRRNGQVEEPVGRRGHPAAAPGVVPRRDRPRA